MHTPSKHQPRKSPPKSAEYYYFQIFKQDIVYKKRSSYLEKRTTSSDSKRNRNTRKLFSEKLERITLLDSQNKRGAIQSFSRKSKHRLMHQLRNSQHSFKQIITLTYPKWFPKDGAIVKSHLNTFLTRLRQVYPGVHYMWVFESQSRGAPHFHLIINVDLPFVEMHDIHGFYCHSRKWSERWSKITGNEKSPAHTRHGLRIDPITTSDSTKLAFYLAKYYAKNEKKEPAKDDNVNKEGSEKENKKSKQAQKKFDRDFKNIGRYWGASRGFTTPIHEGIYQAVDLKWMLKLCFHYANLERVRAGFKAFRFNTERGCSIWDSRKWFDKLIVPQFKTRLENRFMDLHSPKIERPDLSIYNISFEDD